jgi:uncharacterized protein
VKINPGWHPTSKNVKVSENSVPSHTSSRNFSEMMIRHANKVTQEQLVRLFEQIGLQGDRLSRNMTLRELRQYKLLVKKFLEETARRGVHLKDTRGWDRRGRSKRYKLLEEVDAELLQMAEELLETEQGRIELLHQIGEIRGMLIHFLY